MVSSSFMEKLPVDDILPELLTALGNGNSAVLSAPPGAGKTTGVPLALLDAPWLQGRVLMLEPRRVAARAAAERLAAGLGEAVGDSVGYRIRGEARPGRRIEVVTEGILTRMLQSDPELPGIGAIIFDEVHERSIHSDLGLALTLEVQEALRPELRLLAMSATLDVEGFARLMGGASIIESEGRAHPVETRWLERSWRRPGEGRRLYVDAATALIVQAWNETSEGDLLAFLPGAGEIGRVAARLRAEAPRMEMAGMEVAELHGSLPFRCQREVLERGTGRRRVVLATSIAETSLTVPGVHVVVDTGLARRSRTDAGTGLSKLVTVPVSRAEADQRRGRAGRLAPGICYRMWTKGEEGGLPPYAPPEILEADLAPLVLELALWGAAPASLRWLDAPADAGLAAARALLHALDALDHDNRITAHGRAMAEQPLHPRLAHMVLCAEADGMGQEAALLAALLQERDPLRGAGADIGLRLPALSTRSGHLRADTAILARIRAEARRIAGRSRRRNGAAMMTERTVFEAVDGMTSPGAIPPAAKKGADPATVQKTVLRQIGTAPTGAVAAHAGPLAALAYPDRIALRRPGGEPRFLLSNGRGAVLDATDPLAGERLLVAVDVTDGTEARIRLAAPITEGELRDTLGRRIRESTDVSWSPRTARVEARRREMLGAIALADEPWQDAPTQAIAAALLDGIRALGVGALDWSPAALSLRTRVEWLRQQQGSDLAGRLPDWSDAGLETILEQWLLPWLGAERRIENISVDLLAALRAMLDHELLREIDRAAPSHFETPLGRARIDYSGTEPAISVRVQEMFGITRHPMIGSPPRPLVIELLSPARRPVQKTSDLPGFWASSYADVRRDMRARYPKHPWPEDPASAEATRRTKPRGK